MQLLAAAPRGGDEVRRLEQIQVLGHALPCHVHVVAQIIERAAIVRMQQIQKLPPARVGEGLEQQVGVTAVLGHRQVGNCMKYMQVKPCMSNRRRMSHNGELVQRRGSDMNKNVIGIALLVAGIILLVWGYNMSGAFDSKVSRVFTGSPTDKAMWTMIGGAVLAVAGAAQLLFRK